MPGLDVQLLTLLEALLLLATNGAGGALTLLAWHASQVDVREARAWAPTTPDPVERLRQRHNRLVVAQDGRYAERGRFLAHLCAGLLAAVWIVTPQPVNPDVVWWAVLARASALAFSLVLIDKTLHHLTARWRFDKPWTGSDVCRLAYLGPALLLAWRDWRGSS